LASRKDYALHYFDNGFIPIPLCWTNGRECGCFYKHTDPQMIGKAPLVKYKGFEITKDIVSHWFTRFPLANIGILLKESNLLVIDADSEAAVEEVEKWLDTEFTPFVKTGRGKHYYYNTKPSTLIYRTTHKGDSKAIDVFSNGYVVAPPSIHMSGHHYEWISPPKLTGIPIVPTKVEEFLVKEREKTGFVFDTEDISPSTIKLQKINLDDLPINDFLKSIIKGGKKSPYYKERGYQSRSHAIYGVIIACLNSGLSDEQICSILTDPRNGISQKIIEQRKKLEWVLGEIKRAKKRVVPQRLHS
jgi:hypothetical protein